MTNDKKQIEFTMNMLSAVIGDKDRGIIERLEEEQKSQLVNTLFQITNMMPGGFFVYRAYETEELLYANAALLRIFGCENLTEFRELTGGSFRGMVHPEDLERVEGSIWEQIANSQHDLDYVEYRIVQKSGEVRWIEDYGHFVHNELLGDVFFVFVSDATENHLRRQAQIESISRERLQHLEVIEGLSADYTSIFYVDLDANQLQAYRIGEHIQNQFPDGQATATFEGFAEEYIDTWVIPEDRELVSQALRGASLRTMLAKTRAAQLNYRVRYEGRIEYLQMQMVSVNGGDRVSQVVLGVRNVDGEIRKGMRQREALEDALKRANAAATVKKAFLANMSHDMRTPMNAIMGFTTLAKKNLTEPEVLRGYLDQIETSAGKLLHLINDVLELSRVEAGIGAVEESPCDLLDVVREVQAQALTLAMAKRQQLITDVSRLRHSAVYSDADSLVNMMMRLVGNAVNFTPNGGTITIAVEELDDAPEGYGKYRFSVADTGVGIAPEFLRQIFEPFERERNTTQSGLPGTGLGLTIVRSIVDMMEGTIQVESAPGEGSRFLVTVMFRLQNDACGTGEPAVEAAFAGKKVLVVEDNELNMEIELALLEDGGFLTDTAENGSIAVEKVKASRPGEYALILMDIQMPVMNGYEAARAIRALPDKALASIPIIAVSANAFEENMRLSMESGMNAHLAKPISLPELLRTIGTVLTAHNRSQ